MRKLNHIDSTRGLAILMVVMVHSSHHISGLSSIAYWTTAYGQMGVQLFFVASAFTLSLSATRRKGEESATSKYWIRRIARIAPMYYLGILLYFLISVISGYLDYGQLTVLSKYSWENIMSNMTFVHGFYPPANNNIVPGGWSIGTEMAFYLIFPVLFLIAERTIKKRPKWILLWIFSGYAISQLIILILDSQGLSIAKNNFVYYNLANQLSVFFIGIAYYFYWENRKRTGNVLFDVFAVFFISAFAIWLFQVRLDWVFTLIPFVSGISFVFIIEVLRKVEFLNHRLLRRIGQISYSMYLLHFFFVDIARHYLFSMLGDTLPAEILLVLIFISTVGLTYFAALLTERLIEKPFVRLGKRLIQNMDTKTSAH